MSKTCIKCGETKPLDGFHRKKGGVDGRNSRCKECMLEYARRYRKENRDKVRESNRRYYEGNRDKVRDINRRYRKENRDKEREYYRRYRKENRDERREYDRRYHEENRDILNQGTKMHRAQYTRISNLLASKKGTPYSPDEDAFLMADNGMSVYQKAVELGRTYESCSSRLRLLRRREAADV